MTRAPAPAELPVKPGGIVDGKFRVERLLGAGGMGVVVEATHLLLRQRVALKFIRREIARDQTNVTRFLREARACVQLRGENIARIMDVGTLPDDTPFIVMEYLEGRNADEMLREGGPLPAATAVAYVLQACVGMAEAHALGIVHRDLKPHNLFVTTTPAGRPLIKILDFGISKAALAGAEDLGLTDSRTIVGSPAYMAPEQMESSRDVDLRADIWSLGAILFALVSGGPPFRGQSLLQLCARVESGEREVIDAALAVPPDVLEVIDACLRRAPGQRPSDLADLAARLAPCTPGGDELAAEVAATLRTTRPPPTGDTPSPSTSPAGAMATTVASSDESIVGATSTPSPAPGPPSRRRRAILAIALVTAVALAAAWFATQGRSKTNTAGTPDRSALVDAGAAVDAGAGDTVTMDAGTPDTASGIDASVRMNRAPRDPRVNRVTPPPPPPPPPLPPDAGDSDSRHPRDRRN